MVPATCLLGTPLKALSPNAKIRWNPGPGCDYRTTNLDYLINLPMTHQVQVHRSCVCNELISLHNRHLVDRTRVDYDKGYISLCFAAHRRSILECMETVQPISYVEVISRYRGAKRATYMKAFDEVRCVGYQQTWSRVSMFVKPDRYEADAIFDKAPRAIQHRRPAYNLMLARYLHPFEKEFYQIKPEFNGFKLAVAKGRNNLQRAADLSALFSDFDEPAFLLIDHSKFDSCCTVEHFKELHKMYLSKLPYKTLRMLLLCQLYNKGRTKGGIQYRVKGTRMSGDYNTALDNTLLNLVILRSWLAGLGVEARYYVDGDDSVVIIEKRDEHKTYDVSHFGRFGFETVIQRVYDPSEVEFCRAKFLDSEIPLLARNPYRALSNMSYGLKVYAGRARQRYLAGNALGEMHRSAGIPIVYPIAEAIYAKYGGKGVMLDTEGQYKLDLYRVDSFIPITLEAREAYAIAYGIDISTQIEIETKALQSIRLLDQRDIGTFSLLCAQPSCQRDLEVQYAS